MATIPQLENLIHLQKLFSAEDSLESAVTLERLEKLIIRTEQLIRQRAFMREERRILRISSAKVDDYNNALKTLAKPQWFNDTILQNNQLMTRRILINVGGLMFETTEVILTRDEGSLLAKLCTHPPPVEPDPDGFFVFDRDWWLFRYILMFLRDGILPNDEQSLAKLYREASFWKLKSLQRAIEEEKLHLPGTNPCPEKAEWWKKCPSWWEMTPPPPAPAPPPEDWWKGDTYKGKKFSFEAMPK